MFKKMYAEAEACLNKSLSAASEYGFRREVALSYEFLGEVFYHQKQYKSALTSLKKAEKIALEIAPEGDIAVEVYRRLGDVYLALGNLEKAENSLARAHSLCERLNDRYELGSVLRAYGMIAYKKKDLSLASSFFNEAIVTFNLIKESFEQARTLQQSAECIRLWLEEQSPGATPEGELLEKAREQAVEASHLFNNIDLPDRARNCENIAQRLEKRMGNHIPIRRFRKIIFDKKWLKEDCIVAASASMERAIKKIHSLAPGDVPVMITGETGTGKEIAARVIHNLSSRSNGPFLPVNCASLPESVFESELFGYKKGAFTGAHTDHQGLFEKASGGTLFLDEVSELSPGQQAKLLRALQEKSIRRVGESAERSVDVRLISASNSNVRSLVESGRLRTDFYYRISAGTVELEPLRERKGDIIPLFSYYLEQSGCEFKVEEEAVDLLLRHYWPGNVRELINTTEVLVLLGRNSRTIRAKDLPMLIRDFSDSQPRTSSIPPISEVAQDSRSAADMPVEGTDEFRHQLETSLSKYRGNKSAVARDLGIGRSTLYRHLVKLGLR
ncbi:MAG: sigma 54-interacting transcriptional regulator [Candidatus Krumholzibacteriota bacterium]|nr:sigma 54-interacting transcriptional regulator [Candidatus Krumholzibacteriota bacterium]